MRPIAINVFTARVMMYASAQTPRLLLGYVLGPVQVGLFTLAGRFLRHDHVHDGVSAHRRRRVLSLGLSQTAAVSSPSCSLAMVRDVALVAAPLMLGAAAVMPELYRIWLDPRWLPGVASAQLLLLSGPPLALVYCFDAAFLAARLPSLFRRTSTIQAATTAVTMLLAASLRPRCHLSRPAAPQLGSATGLCVVATPQVPVGASAYLRLPLRLLAGAALMAVALYLPWWRPEGSTRGSSLSG